MSRFHSKFSLTNWGTFLIDLSKSKDELWKNLRIILGYRTEDDEEIPLSKRGLVSP